jgi:hypothetical protein
MKNLIKGLWIILIIVCFGLTGCSKPDTLQTSITLSFLLTNNQKTLFNYFVPNGTIPFFDSNSTNILLLKPYAEVDQTTEDFREPAPIGEHFNLYYNESTSFFNNLKIETDLIASPNQQCFIGIRFSTNSSGGYFAFNPYDTNIIDTLYNGSNNNGFNYTSEFLGDYGHQFLNNVTLSSHTFNNVFLLRTNSYDTTGNFDSCYYALNKGIVAFKVINGAFWIREN